MSLSSTTMDSKTTAEALGLQAPMPTVAKYHKNIVYGCSILGILIFGVASYLTAIKQEKQLANAPRRLVDEDYRPTIPLNLMTQKVAYDSGPIKAPILESSGHQVETFKAPEVLPKPQLRERPLESNGSHELFADAKREAYLQKLELEKQAWRSDLVLAQADNSLSGSGISGRDAQDPSSLPTYDPGTDDNGYKAQNGQAEKRAFLEKKESTQTQKAFHTQAIDSPYTLVAGTAIPCTLETAIHSDMPGSLRARVREQVFDSMRGRHLLIPQGAVLIGAYNSDISYGQERVQVVFNRILFQPTSEYPHGYSLQLESCQGSDLAGHAGLQDRVNHHFGRLFGSAMLSSVLSVGLGETSGERLWPKSRRQLLAENLSRDINEVGQKLVSRQLNQAPTITIRPGAPFNIVVQKDIVLNPRPQ